MEALAKIEAGVKKANLRLQLGVTDGTLKLQMNATLQSWRQWS